MADVGPSGLPLGTFELKIGKSFSKSRKKPEYHTMRYDFKPKSISGEPETYISITSNDDVQIAMASEGKDDITIYKGAKKPIKDGKECLLIFDEATGELRIEKIASNISVKQTRRAAGNEGDNLFRSLIQDKRRAKPSTMPAKSNAANKKKLPESHLKDQKENMAEDEKHEEDKVRNVEHMSSSSDSASSLSESSDSSDESGPEAKSATQNGHNGDGRGRLESSNFSSDDEAALEKHLNAPGPTSSRTPPPDRAKTLTSQHQVDSLFAELDMPPLSKHKPAPALPSAAHPKKLEKNQMLLQNDLDLSESSDED